MHYKSTTQLHGIVIALQTTLDAVQTLCSLAILTRKKASVLLRKGGFGEKKVVETPFIPAACDTMESLSSRRDSTEQKQVFDKGISVYCLSCGEQKVAYYFMVQNNCSDGKLCRKVEGLQTTDSTLPQTKRRYVSLSATCLH